mgnify:CR=1 FL=1
MSNKAKRAIFKLSAFFVSFSIIFTLFNINTIVFAKNINKITDSLQDKIAIVEDDFEIPVMIFNDFDIDTEEKINKNQIPIVNSNFLSKNNTLQELSIDEIQNTIAIERQKSKAYHEKLNKMLAESLGISEKVLFYSSYAPVFFAKLTKNEIKKTISNNNISKIAYCDENLEFEQYLDISKTTTNAHTIQNNSTFFGYTGTGVKIGILEKYIPYIYAPWLLNADITPSSNDSNFMESSYGGHATTVTSIIASNGSSNTSVGIAPDAKFYCSSLFAFADALLQIDENTPIGMIYATALEWLVEQNVNIINISVGFANIYNSYTTTIYDDYVYYMSWLIDYYTNTYNIVFSMAAGNSNTTGIAFPAMAYNAITVGNTNDKNTKTNSDDVLSSSSSYNNVLTPIYASKPDICAPGTLININGSDLTYIGNNLEYDSTQYAETSGTSFSAPHVAGAIALLFDQEPLLLYSPESVKAILTAGVFSSCSYVPSDRVLTTNVDNPANSYIQYGAGLINCVANGSIVTKENYDFGFINTNTTITSESLTLSGQKNVRISFAYNLNTDNHNMAIDNFDIFLYDPNGNLVGSSTTTFNNIEIIDTYISTSGTYTLSTVRQSSTSRIIDIGLAWIQY